MGGEGQAQNLLVLQIQEAVTPSFLSVCVCKVGLLVPRLCLTPRGTGSQMGLSPTQP